jgi:hypothetical protein
LKERLRLLGNKHRGGTPQTSNPDRNAIADASRCSFGVALHPKLPEVGRDLCDPEFFLVAELSHVLDRTTPPLCSTSITDASTLVPVTPSLTGASIFLLVVPPLVVSLHITRQLSPSPCSRLASVDADAADIRTWVFRPAQLSEFRVIPY